MDKKNLFEKIIFKFFLIIFTSFCVLFLIFFTYYFYQLKFGEAEKISELNSNFSEVKNSKNIEAQTNVENWEMLMNNYNPTKGDPNAQIKIIAFMDFECSYCREDYNKLLDMQNKFPISQIVFKYSPILIDSTNTTYNSALAAACANEQGSFWEYYKKLFSDLDHSQKNLYEMAEEINLDVENFQNCFESDTYKNQINKDLQDFSDYNLRGTPTYIINGELIEGVQSEDVWTNKIIKIINN